MVSEMDSIVIDVSRPFKIKLIDKTDNWEQESATLIISLASVRHPGFVIHIGELTDNVSCVTESDEQLEELECRLCG